MTFLIFSYFSGCNFLKSGRSQKRTQTAHKVTCPILCSRQIRGKQNSANHNYHSHKLLLTKVKTMTVTSNNCETVLCLLSPNHNKCLHFLLAISYCKYWYVKESLLWNSITLSLARMTGGLKGTVIMVINFLSHISEVILLTCFCTSMGWFH